MLKSMSQRMVQLWQEDAGSVIATEYLVLGSLVALGGVAGLATVRDATNDEMAEYAKSIRAVGEEHKAPGYRSGTAETEGSAALDRSAEHNLAP